MLKIVVLQVLPDDRVRIIVAGDAATSDDVHGCLLSTATTVRISEEAA
jgi:hypothetical protein